MKAIEVLAARYDVSSDRIIVLKEITNDDDSTEINAHAFPPDLFEWLSATYGIEDLDELVDIVLYEPFVRHDDALGLSVADARTSCRSKTASAKTQYTKVSPISTSAVVRLQAKGVDAIFIEAAEENPRDVIRAHALIDPEVIAVKREYVSRQRALRQTPIEAAGAVPRATQVARMLNQKSTEQRATQPQPPQLRPGTLPTVVLTGKQHRAH